MGQKNEASVSLRFTGNGAKAAAKRFMIWFLDGGGEQYVMEDLETVALLTDGVSSFNLEEGILELAVEPGENYDSEA